MTMRVGLVEVKDGGSWGRVGGECRHARHRYSPWENFTHDDQPTWARGCRRCGWTYTVVPVIAGPHVVDRYVGGKLGLPPIAVCRCGSVH